MLLDDESIQKSEPVLIREFRDKESLSEMQAHFEKAGIPYSIFDTISRFDVTFSYDQSRRGFQLLVPAHFAEQARRICETVEAAVIEQLPADYYLFEFSNEELQSVIIRSFEWSPLDVSLARQILIKRGIDPGNEELARNESESKAAFNAPERMDTLSLIWGYLFSAIGGLLGIGFVIYILSGKKITDDGRKINRYDQQMHQHAIYMIMTLLVSTCLYTTYYVLNAPF